VSALGFGCGSIGGLMVRGEAAEQRAAVERALEGGITYFDTAAQYGEGRSEENLGRVLREVGADVAVGTKIELAAEQVADAPAALRRALEAGLRRLGRERVDLCQLHNRTISGPSEGRTLNVDDVCGPVAAGMRALCDAGLTRFVGITGLGDTAAVLRVAASGGFDSVQCYYNPLNPSAGYASATDGMAQDFGGLIDRAAEAGLGVVAIRVLAAGALADTARHPVAGGTGHTLVPGAEYDRDEARAAALRPLLGELGVAGGAELGIRFALAKRGVSTVLVGFSDRAQVDEALRAAECGPLPAAAVEQVVAVARSVPPF
jgi:aryl-alcohol dehydrogenase-like predicted oxidoreductase